MYDVVSAQAKIIAAGLPDVLAHRLGETAGGRDYRSLGAQRPLAAAIATGAPVAIAALDASRHRGRGCAALGARTAVWRRTVDATTFTLAAGASRNIAVSFNCSTQTSFTGTMRITATGGSVTDAKTVPVTGTIN